MFKNLIMFFIHFLPQNWITRNLPTPPPVHNSFETCCMDFALISSQIWSLTEWNTEKTRPPKIEDELSVLNCRIFGEYSEYRAELFWLAARKRWDFFWLGRNIVKLWNCEGNGVRRKHLFPRRFLASKIK